MFTEQQLRSAVLDAIRLHEESFVKNEKKLAGGEYKRDELECAVEACTLNGLPTTMARLIDLSLHWSNDVQDWATGRYDEEEPVLPKEKN